MDTTQKKILIAEDDRILRDALVHAFEHEGFLVITAENGQLAYDLAVRENPDMILLDIIMPIMDGLSMLKLLRDDPKGKDIPVIVLTNLTDSKTTLINVENGVYDYLVKTDWKIKDVVEKVKQRLTSS